MAICTLIRHKLFHFVPKLIVKWRLAFLLTLTLLILINTQYLYFNKVTVRRPRTRITFIKKDLCDSPTAENSDQRTVVIVVLSARQHFDHRNLIRQTYGSVKSANNVRILAAVFLLGNRDSQGAEKTDNRKLQAETDQYGDIIVGDFIDSYRNLTLKTIMAYEWLTSYCRQAQIVVKTDDDVFVNIYQLTKEIDSWSPEDLRSSNIWGNIHRNESTVNKPDSKFYASPLDFPDGKFPEHCAGIGYVTPIGVIDRIMNDVSRSFPGRICTHEDVFITGIVRNHVNSVQSMFRQEFEPIELVNRTFEWRSIDLEDGRGDEDYFLRNFIKQTTNANETENLKEFRRRYSTKIFYLITHSVDFKENYLRLWQIIKKSFSN